MKNILIVEDDLVFCKMLQNLFAKNGYRSDYAQSIKEAKEQISLKQHDLIILDYKLPDATGLDLVDWMRDENIHIHIIMVTRVYAENVMAQAIAKGVDHFIRKPFDSKELLYKVGTVLI